MTKAMKPAPESSGQTTRTLLWLALVVSAAANVVISSTGLPMLIGAGFGLLTLVCAVTLVGRHRRQAR